MGEAAGYKATGSLPKTLENMLSTLVMENGSWQMDHGKFTQIYMGFHVVLGLAVAAMQTMQAAIQNTIAQQYSNTLPIKGNLLHS